MQLPPIAPLVLAAMALGSCASNPASLAAPDASPASLAYGYDSALDAREGLVIRDASTWSRVWSEHHRRRLPVPPLPEIDFAREMVLAITCGSRPTAGYGLRVVSALERGGKLIVTVRESTPKLGAILPSVVTTPYAMVRVPRFEGPVVFELE